MAKKPFREIKNLTVAEVMAIWNAAAALAPPDKQRKAGNATPTDTLIEGIKSGASLHEACRGLAWRGWTVEQLQSLMEQSAARADRPADWRKEFDDLERTVRTAREKRSADAKREFGPPPPIPPGCIGPDDPRYNEIRLYRDKLAITDRRSAQREEARRIGEGEDEPDLLPIVMDLEAMVRDLVFVGDNGAVVHLPSRRVRKADRARQEFAASKQYWIDANGTRREAEAFKLWIEDRRRKSVDVITWSPSQPVICNAPEREEGGEKAVNLWNGWNAWDAPNDWQSRLEIWHEHLAFLIPDEAERREFEQWLAHIAQKPGELPHRFYLMVTPSQGVGRNWLQGVLARVFRGYVAAGLQIGPLLGGGFTGRLGRKVLVIVDEAQEGASGNKFEKANTLKQMVTVEVREVNPKYGVSRVETNCARWLMFSNHEDAIPIDNKDRRCVVIRNPDAPRDTAYYDRIYAAVREPLFIASVWKYLNTLNISDFNAQKPAAMTDAKRAVIASMESETTKALRRFFSEWPGEMVDRRTLTQYIADETDGRVPHAKHFRRCLDEIGAVVRDKRVRNYGRDETIIGMGIEKDSLDRMDNAEIVRRISEARGKTTFEIE